MGMGWGGGRDGDLVGNDGGGGGGDIEGGAV